MVTKLIVGLGNPGPVYARNRHNVGYRCVDALARAHGLSFARRQFRALVAGGPICGRPALLAKPLTFMNLSGNAVGALMRFYKLAPADLIVVYDDLDLPLGRVRLRAAGGSGGHKGMQSIIERLGTEEFARLRVGIGRPAFGDPVEYVLQNFGPDEEIEIGRALERAVKALEAWLSDGIEAAMNRFNRASELEVGAP
jgi:PTH1 family peptidyl-tRNA hydrolase